MQLVRLEPARDPVLPVANHIERCEAHGTVGERCCADVAVTRRKAELLVCVQAPAEPDIDIVVERLRQRENRIPAEAV